MTFAESVRICLRKSIDFSGRATRPEYWWFALFYWIATFAIWFVALMFSVEAGLVAMLLALAVLLVPMTAAAFRRLHDTGRRGWLALLPFLAPPVTFIAILIILVVLAVADVASSSFNPTNPGEGLAKLWFASAFIGSAITGLLLIWWLTRPSQPHDNRYGPNPVDGPEKIF